MQKRPFGTPIFIVAVCCALAGPSFAEQKQNETDPNAPDQIRLRLGEYLDSLAATGVSGCVLIRQDEKLLVQRSFGLADREAKVAIDDGTVFDIGSIAKTFTAAAILKLQDQGRLKLNDTIQTHLESVPQDKQRITIHQLLTHTAGLENHHTPYDFFPMTRQQAVKRSLAAPLRWEPGTNEGYSNAGYALLAAIIELVTGESFQSYVKRELITPAKLTSTGWYIDEVLDGRQVAYGYVGDRKRGVPIKWKLTWSLIGGGGMLSTVDDLDRWQRELFHGKLLSNEARSELRRAPDQSWTSGWQRRNRDAGPVIEKGGANDFGFTGNIQYYFESGHVVVMLFNSKPGEGYPHNEVAREVDRILQAESPSTTE